jgi:hypothetical protein
VEAGRGMDLHLVHRVEQHKSNVEGTEMMTLFTNHHFPHHFHDQFAIGVMTVGTHRSWSGTRPVQLLVVGSVLNTLEEIG